jgi:hypothetical protein
MVQSAVRHAIEVSRKGDDGSDPHGLFQALNDAAIVRYGRCFLACVLPDGRAKTKLPERYGFEGPLGEVHTKVMAMRHGLVAHADLRERRIVLCRDRSNEGRKWHINTSGGAIPPIGAMTLSSLCQQLRNRLVEEVRPLIEKRIDMMDEGQELDLASLVENPQAGNVFWLDE